MKTFLVETLLINEKNIFLMNVFDLSIDSFNSDALEFLSLWKTHMYLILLFCSSSFYTYFAVFFLFSHCRLFVFVYNIGVSQHQHIWMTMMRSISLVACHVRKTPKTFQYQLKMLRRWLICFPHSFSWSLDSLSSRSRLYFLNLSFSRHILR